MVAIILIVAGLAVPNLIQSKARANEASAVTSLKLMAKANAAYNSLYAQGYAGSLAQLGPPGVACASVSSACGDLLDSQLSGLNPAAATPVKSGYRFTYLAPNAIPSPATQNVTFSAVATPILPNNTGVSTFCTDPRANVMKDSSGSQTMADNTGCAATWPTGGSISPL